jgi:hypothetical protein
VHDHAERKASYARLAAAMDIAPIANPLVASA